MPVEIVGLRQFRTDLRRASQAFNRQAPTRELTAILKAAGVPVARKAAGYAPTGSGHDPHPGLLKSGYRARARASSGSIVSKVAYAAGAEWGSRGKWRGFSRYGGPGRFAYRAVQESQVEIALAIQRGMREFVTVFGWFR